MPTRPNTLLKGSAYNNKVHTGFYSKFDCTDTAIYLL